MSAAPEVTLFWGLTWANIIAFGGILASLIWNFVNTWRTSATRKNTLALDYFSSTVKAPLTDRITELGNHMDAADEIFLRKAAIDVKIKSVAELKTAFHATRRVLARLLTDYDESKLIDGDSWGEIEANDMDNATDALEHAMVTRTEDDLKRRLLDFVTSLNDFRTRLQRHLDDHAKKLMR